jgi:hypothetical protein
MNAILEPFKSLWRRKLWPVAVLLVGALAAVPIVLAKEPVAAPAPAANAAAKANQGMPATFVAAADPAEEGDRRRVLGEAKDPFAPAALSAKAKAARKKAAAKRKATEKSSKESPAGEKSSTGGDNSTGSAGGGSTPSGPPASAAPTPTVTVPKYSVKVRFGSTDAEQEPAAKTVERLAVLPDDENPLVVYRGVEDGGKVAVFELTGTVVAIGDGKCEPNPDNCQILKLRAGETEFLTISDTGDETDAQYQLSLLKINQKQTTEKASESEALKKSAGSKLLGKLDRKPRYAFDPKTGTLHKVRKK